MPAAKQEPAGTSSAVVEAEISAAKELEARKQDILKAIDDNRQTLRLFDRRKMLDEDQGIWLDTFYPAKTRNGGDKRSREDIDATRKLREAAVKEVRAGK